MPTPEDYYEQSQQAAQGVRPQIPQEELHPPAPRQAVDKVLTTPDGTWRFLGGKWNFEPNMIRIQNDPEVRKAMPITPARDTVGGPGPFEGGGEVYPAQDFEHRVYDVKTKAELDALPMGAVFRTPDGNLKRKNAAPDAGYVQA